MPKHVAEKDPHQAREAQKYDNPIPSREFIMELLAKAGQPMYRDDIAAALGMESEEQLEALRRRLRAMERDGQLLFNRRGGFGLVSKMDLVRGRVIGHADEFGFLVPDDGGDDLFLSAREMHNCLHGDRVVARVSGVDRRGRREGAIVEVLEHANKHVAGSYFIDQGVGYVIADNKRINQDILVPSGQEMGAVNGQLVVVEIVEYPTARRQATGKIIEILGDHMAPGLEIDVAIRAHDLPMEWSAPVREMVAALPTGVPDEAKAGRTDLRAMPLVTIDGEDSMDFDDAVYCEPSADGGWRLVVAIADVSHYVAPGTTLDEEARERGNSVYFPGRVLPMLPEELSNGLCSINPAVDRLCMVCDMDISKKGKLHEYRFYQAVMRSHARMTYNKVNAIVVERDGELCREYDAVRPHLENLYTLFKLLHRRREERGAIDFETTETRVVFGEGKKIDRIVATERNDAHRLIEECMLMANVATARFLSKAKIPALYRDHDRPNSEKLTALREFLSELGLDLKGGDEPAAADYGELLASIKGRPDAHLIQTVMLRSMQRAVYSPDNKGHFGLAFDAYAHFTSPIRRYPDLLVHRAIRHVISGKPVEEFRYSHDDMVLLGEHCSMTERRADEATRDAMDWLKCEFMLDKVGERFEGVISSVTGFGIFVELKDIYVEGLVHVSSFKNDYYHFDPAHHRLVGERSRKIYRLGDSVEVLVARVDLDDKKIDFDLMQEEVAAPPPEEKPRKPKRRSKKR
ncbi:MAG: ribonuclease R [Gammaproteobacteria bacterium]|nr:ribonuclease R [Gammaproteobacteria bacterium]